MRLSAIAVILLFQALSSAAGFAQTNQTNGTRDRTLSIGLSGLRHVLNTGDGNDLVGNSAQVSLGAGLIDQMWYARLSADLYLGPYDPIRSGELNSEFEGTGLTLFGGYSAQSLDLRSLEGSYGFGFGLSYADIIGRSVGRNRRLNRGDDPDAEDFLRDYTIRITHLSFAPAIFFSWFNERGGRTNAPEDLATRIEGTELVAGVSLPIYSRYSARYQLTDANEAVLGRNTDRGKLKGHTIFVNVTIYLGI